MPSGEPPYVLSNSVYFALRKAIDAARLDAGIQGWYALDVPAKVAHST